MPTTLVITNDFPPRIGGIESFVEDICTLLDADVAVYASGPPGAAEADPRRGFPVVRAGSLLLPTPRTANRAVELLHRFGASRVIFGAAAPLGLLAPALRRAGAQRIVGLTHGHEAWWSAVPGARRLLRRIGDGCDHLTTISGYTERRIARALSASGRERMLRLPPPVDVNQFRPGAVDHDRSRCVAVGRFVAQKGFSCLLNTWRLILDGRRDADPPLELILIGDGPQRTRLESMLDRLGLRATVTLTGAIPRAAVISELQQATVFALPVRTRLSGLNPEGLGLAALEAAACGLPVIIGDSGGTAETVRDGETGYLLAADDHHAWARRIAELLDDRARAREMGRAGRAHVIERFGSDQARTTLQRALQL